MSACPDSLVESDIVWRFRSLLLHTHTHTSTRQPVYTRHCLTSTTWPARDVLYDLDFVLDLYTCSGFIYEQERIEGTCRSMYCLLQQPATYEWLIKSVVV